MELKLNKPKEVNFNDIKIGQKTSFVLQLTEEMLEKFAQISGDYNPLHMDTLYAKNSKFGERISHGMLLGIFFSQLVGMHMPGKKCLYLSQTLNFENPCFVPEILTVEGIVKQKSESTKILEILTQIKNKNNILLVDGYAKVMFLD